MSYTPPLGNAIGLRLVGAYTPPSGDQIHLTLGPDGNGYVSFLTGEGYLNSGAAAAGIGTLRIDGEAVVSESDTPPTGAANRSIGITGEGLCFSSFANGAGRLSFVGAGAGKQYPFGIGVATILSASGNCSINTIGEFYGLVPFEGVEGAYVQSVTGLGVATLRVGGQATSLMSLLGAGVALLKVQGLASGVVGASGTALAYIAPVSQSYGVRGCVSAAAGLLAVKSVGASWFPSPLLGNSIINIFGQGLGEVRKAYTMTGYMDQFLAGSGVAVGGVAYPEPDAVAVFTKRNVVEVFHAI